MTCSWERGCWQQAESGSKVCYYHGKLLAGRIDSQEGAYRDPKKISPAQVVSDEQLLIAQVLKSMGASEQVVKRAFTRFRRTVDDR